MYRFYSACLAAVGVSVAVGGPTSTYVAGPFEIDIPAHNSACNNYFALDQNLERPGFQVLVNVYEEYDENSTFADGVLKTRLVVQTTGAESKNGKAAVLGETRGSRNRFSQSGETAFVNNGVLFIPGSACEAGPDNTAVDLRLTVFTLHFDAHLGCSRFPLEEVQFVRSGECIADFNEDGGIDGSDVYDFYQAWERYIPTADINGDLCIDAADVEAFFAPWENGGC